MSGPKEFDRRAASTLRKNVRRGLVLGAGAALGAYQAGALKALREQGISFEVISVASIGVLNALAWNIDDMILRIDELWMKHTATLRPFNPRKLLRGRNPFQFKASVDGVFDLHRGAYEQQTEGTEVLVGLSEFETTRLQVFSTRDPALSEEDRESLFKAAMTLPHLGIQPVPIAGHRYFDGGFVDILPVAPIAGRNLDEIWLVPVLPLWKANRLSRALKPEEPALIERSSNPYVRPLLGLLEQSLWPPERTTIAPRTFVVEPSSALVRFFEFRFAHALLFSRRNIRHLLKQGYRDGLRICRDYRAG